MTITKQKDAGVLTVSIEGSLDISTSPKLSESLEGELDDVNEVHFDLAKTDYTSSAGLRVILHTYQILDDKNGTVILDNVNDGFYAILKTCGFTEFLEINKRD